MPDGCRLEEPASALSSSAMFAAIPRLWPDVRRLRLGSGRGHALATSQECEGLAQL